MSPSLSAVPEDKEVCKWCDFKMICGHDKRYSKLPPGSGKTWNLE